MVLGSAAFAACPWASRKRGCEQGLSAENNYQPTHHIKKILVAVKGKETLVTMQEERAQHSVVTGVQFIT